MQCFITRQNVEKKVENMMRRGVVFTNFEVFHLVMNHCIKRLTLLLKQNDFKRN